MPWLVNKQYHGGECVQEYAICRACRDQVAETFSEESREAVRTFLEQAVDWEARVAGCMMAHDPLVWISHCIACRTEREQTRRFTLSALFDDGGRLVMGALPLMICGECVGRATAGVSDQSRAAWRAFVDNYFWGPANDIDDGFGVF